MFKVVFRGCATAGLTSSRSGRNPHGAWTLGSVPRARFRFMHAGIFQDLTTFFNSHVTFFVRRPHRRFWTLQSLQMSPAKQARVWLCGTILKLNLVTLALWAIELLSYLSFCINIS